ncbi:MAG: hypothetical protein V8T10_09120 [Merdibacter sp.]
MRRESASDKEDTGKKKTDGRQVKAAINVIRKKVKAPAAQADEGAQPKLTEKISAVFVKGWIRFASRCSGCFPQKSGKR